MGKNRLGLWLAVAVATMVGAGIAAYFALRHEREQSDMGEIQRLIERSQDIVQRIESELDSRDSPATKTPRA